MMVKKFQGPWILLAFLALVLAGCGNENQVGPTGAGQVGVDDFENVDFDLAFGGLTATDEEAAFGDPYLLALEAAEQEEVADDPLAEDPEVLALEALGRDSADGSSRVPEEELPRFTFLRITWGMLDGDPTEPSPDLPEPLDWSGSLTVDRGVVLVRRLIRFERPVDHMVRPRLDRQTVAWFSQTQGHFDGIVVEIIEPAGTFDPELFPEGNQLHFETGPYSATFQVQDLQDRDEIYSVSPEPNAIHFKGISTTGLDACARGFLSGTWILDEEAGGFFRGRWDSLLGRMNGFLRGSCGYNDAGEAVFVGKYIDRQGHFRGLLTGTWDLRSEKPGHGRFQGRWVNANGSQEGRLGGEFLKLNHRPGGFFGGRWAAECDQETDRIFE